MAYTEREAEEAAQIAAAREAFDACRRAELELDQSRFDLVWDKRADGDHLLRVAADGGVQRDFGARSAELDALASKHAQRKAVAISDHQRCMQERERMQRLNRAHGVGRLLVTPMKVLDVLLRRGIMDYYRVIGTYALYAYEAAAGVVFDEETTATNDVDLFLTAAKQMKFEQVVPDRASMLEVLQEADPTFQRDEMQKESAINQDGFAIDFLRREEGQGYTDAIPISRAEGDIYPAQAERSHRFVNSPTFEQVVIGVDGSMTLMRTIDPMTFVEFKSWMAQKKDRDPLKRGRDKLQAEAVKQLLGEGRLVSRLKGG